MPGSESVHPVQYEEYGQASDASGIHHWWCTHPSKCPEGELDITPLVEQNSSAFASFLNLLCNALLTCLWSNGYEAVRIVAFDDTQALLMSPLSTGPRFCKVISTAMAICPCCPMDLEVVEITNFSKCKLALKYSIWPSIPFWFWGWNRGNRYSNDTVTAGGFTDASFSLKPKGSSSNN